MTNARISVPQKAKPGEVIEVKTLISHPMETGFRRDNVGAAIPRNIIKEFICRYNGTEIFRADFFPSIAANPYLTFFTIATESGELVFLWTDQNGETTTQTASITVE